MHSYRLRHLLHISDKIDDIWNAPNRYDVGTFGIKHPESYENPKIFKKLQEAEWKKAHDEEEKKMKEAQMNELKEKKLKMQKMKEKLKAAKLKKGKSKSGRKKHESDEDDEIRLNDQEEEKVIYSKEEQELLENKEYAKISETDVNYVNWDFDNYEVKEFRLLKDISQRYEMVHHNRYPRYLNKVENYKFKYTHVDIEFKGYEFSISVFEKPKDLKEKIAEITHWKFPKAPVSPLKGMNKEEAKSLQNMENIQFKDSRYILRLADKESYIYGDEVLIDFEPIHNALIKGEQLKLKMIKRKKTTAQEYPVRFWTYIGEKEYFKFLAQRRQSDFKYLKERIRKYMFELDPIVSQPISECSEEVVIKIKGYKNLHSIIDLLLKDENYKMLNEKNNKVFRYTGGDQNEMYRNAFQSQEHFSRKLSQMNENQKIKMNELALKLKNTIDLSLFIVVEIGIYEGIMLIARPTYYFTDLFFDRTSKNLRHNNLMKFINQTKMQTPLEYRELQRDARIGINVWCVDSKFRSF